MEPVSEAAVKASSAEKSRQMLIIPGMVSDPHLPTDAAADDNNGYFDCKLPCWKQDA